MPEKLFVLYGVIPSYKDLEQTYARFGYMRTVSRVLAHDYMRNAISFFNDNSDLFVDGIYTDEEFIQNNNKSVKIIGIDGSDEFGVVLWNTSSKYQKPDFQVKLKVDFIGVSDTEKHSLTATDSMEPNSLRLFRYSKR